MRPLPLVMTISRSPWPNALPVDRAVVIAGILGAAAVIPVCLLAASTPEGAVFFAARWTARLSTLLFLAAYSATGLNDLWASRWTDWLARRRRSFGLSFAGAHFIHLGALIAYFAVRRESPVIFQLVIGGIGYLFIVLMTATSFAAGRRLLRPGAWRVLHRVGVHYLAVNFALTYAHGALREGDPWGIMALTCFATAGALRLGRTKKGPVKNHRPELREETSKKGTEC